MFLAGNSLIAALDTHVTARLSLWQFEDKTVFRPDGRHNGIRAFLERDAQELARHFHKDGECDDMMAMYNIIAFRSNLSKHHGVFDGRANSHG